MSSQHARGPNSSQIRFQIHRKYRGDRTQPSGTRLQRPQDYSFGYPTSNLYRQCSTLQLEFLKKNTRLCTISGLAQFEYLLPKAPETAVTDKTHEKQFWPFHKYGYYHLLHSLFEHFDDRVEPLKALVSTGSKSIAHDSEDCGFSSSVNGSISLIDSEEDYVDEEEFGN